MLLQLVVVVLLLFGLNVGVDTQVSNNLEYSPNFHKERIKHLSLGSMLQRLDPLQREEMSDEAADNKEENAAEIAPESQLPVTEVLGINEVVDLLADDYRGLLNEYGITDSTLGSIITILLALLCIGFLVFINRKLSYWFDKKLEIFRKKYNLSGKRFKLYFRFQRLIGDILGILLSLYSIYEFSILSDTLTEHIDFIDVIESFFGVFLVIFIFVTIWEFVNAAAEVLVDKKKSLRSARAQTLIPMARNLLMFLMLLLAGMVILSEIGVDIVPLLAGAGVLGIAVGFGAQKLVQDFLTGFTILLEDLLQIGDIVTLSNRTGTVEKISIRKIQLRHLDGTVYTIPFSEVTIVENLTKDFSYYLMDVGVAYREDIDEVSECLKEVDEGLRNSDQFKRLILEPIEIMGLDQFADSAVVLRARIKTLPKKQWLVGREFNRRLKYLFDQKGIEIPFPHHTLYIGKDKDGSAPSLPVEIT